jgi:Ca2+-binding RTX toxin-like protein
MPIQTTDIKTLSFFQNNEILEIAPGVTVWNDTAAAALTDATYAHVALLNYGVIHNAAGDGIDFGIGSSGSIVNEASGTIEGVAAIRVDSAGLGITNLGSINGLLTGCVMDVASTAIVFDNENLVYGALFGVSDLAASGGNRIVNHGTIKSANYAIDVATAAGKITQIDNSGTISGGQFSITTSAGAVHLINSGKVIGTIQFVAAENDTITNTGSILSKVYLGGGNDVFIGKGGASAAIFGEGGIDHIIGGTTNDLISGGGSSDTLTGGPGRETFLFDAGLGANNIDQITDLQPGFDWIGLDQVVFQGVGPNGILPAATFFAGAGPNDASDRIIYNPQNGFMSFDADGTGNAHSPIHFATAAANLALTNADFVIVG